jgi:soluble cytochrome b562
MKTCRDNLNKLKALCEELKDRDEQLKINASTLWDILTNVQEAKDALGEISADNKETQENIKIIVHKLDGISSLVSERGCKRVAEND